MMTTLLLNILSLCLFGTSILAYKKSPLSLLHQCLFFLCLLFYAVLFTGYWAADYFTGNGIDDAVLFHLEYGLEGAGFLEYAGLMIITALVLGTFTASMGWVTFIHKARKPASRKKIWAYLLILLALYFNPATADVQTLLSGRFEFINNIVETTNDDDFSDYYHQIKITHSPSHKKNIVFIYAESLERTYFDETLFPGLITHLRELQSSSTYFTNITQASDTNWTVAGMLASQCGIPLYMPSHGNAMRGMDSFMQSAVCLGDILAKEGYNLNYMAGGDIEFAGKDKLYKTHGFKKVSGVTELAGKVKDADYRSYWGLYDDSLLDLVYDEFSLLSQSKEPFGLFTLTLDTHHPKGHATKSCSHIRYQDGSNAMLNSVACADYLLSNFIKKIQSSPYAENTLIVLASDHFAMNNDAYDLLTQTKRTNLFMIFNGSNTSTEIASFGSTLDIGTTILPFLGYSGDIGLGRNLAQQNAAQLETLHFIHNNLDRWKHAISKFWHFPQIKEYLDVDAENKTMHIDGRKFLIPALIELSDNLDTTIIFDFDRLVTSNKSLLQHRLEMPDNTSFILLDECADINHFKKTLGSEGLCMISGKGKKNFTMERITGQKRFMVSDIHAMVTAPTFKIQRIYSTKAPNDTAYLDITLLDQGVQQGFLYFEMGFVKTANNDINCIYSNGAASTEYRHSTNPCTLQNLSLWMKNNPTARIIANISMRNNDKLLAALLTLPDAQERIIPQITDPYDFYTIKEKHFQQFIWDISHFNGSDVSIMQWTQQFDRAFAVSMPIAKAKSGITIELNKLNIPVYAQAVNSSTELIELQRDFKVSETYTERLQP